MYLETHNDILPKINRKILIDDKLKNIVPLLNLSEEVKK
jgi:membrane protease subunit HflK